MKNININLNKILGDLKTPWTFGANTCHAILWKRKDLQKHAKKSHEVCGFRYVRFHNFISKWTDVYNEDEQGNPIYNFENLDEIFDNIIKCGYFPFLEISFCPEALSAKPHIFFDGYEPNVAMPDSFEKWESMIKTIVTHFKDRYGIECLKKWYFEVWNEPDLFHDGTMTTDIYFELYDYTVRAVKSVDDALMVGGPATSKCLWVKEFIEHVEKGSEVFGGDRVPCDFISTHAYPSDVAFLDTDYGDVKLQNSNLMYTLFSKTREIMNNSSLSDVPLIMGEWNSSAGPFAINHDHKNNAAYIVKIFDDLGDIIDGSLYWNMSDIYQECGFHHIPFHGGYGLTNVNDIPKSSFNAFALLNELKGKKVETLASGEKGSYGYLSALDEENKVLNILFYNYEEPEEESKEITFDIEINGIDRETTSIFTKTICDEQGSAYEWWLKLGSPWFVNKEILELLEKKSMPKEDELVIFKDNGKYKFKVELGLGDIALYKIQV